MSSLQRICCFLLIIITAMSNLIKNQKACSIPQIMSYRFYSKEMADHIYISNNHTMWYYKNNVSMWAANHILLTDTTLFNPFFQYAYTVLVLANAATDPIRTVLLNQEKQKTAVISFHSATSMTYIDGEFHEHYDESIFDVYWNGNNVGIGGTQTGVGIFKTFRFIIQFLEGINILSLSKHYFVQGSMIGALIYEIEIEDINCFSQN